MQYPHGNIERTEVAPLALHHDQTPGLHSDKAADRRSKNVNQNAKPSTQLIGHQVRNQVNADVFAISCGGYRTNHRKPKHDEFDQAISPDEIDAATEKLPVRNLRNRQQDHRAKQHDKSGVFSEPTELIEFRNEFFQWAYSPPLAATACSLRYSAIYSIISS